MIKLEIPKLGMTMETAKLVEWKFHSGDTVKKEEILFTIETDKLTFEVSSPDEGIIHPIASTGEIYPVSHIVGYLAKSRSEYERLLRGKPTDTPAPVEMQPAREAGKKAMDVALPASVAAEGESRRKASPLARSMAMVHGLNLNEIRGTGPGGRIIREDILKALEEKETTVPEKKPLPGGIDKDYPGKDLMETIPIQGVRKAIFDNMFASLSQTAQTTFHTQACAEALIDLRNRLNQGLEEKERKVSYNAIFVKIASAALRIHPKINSSVENGQIKIWKQIHIGVAMEVEDALVVAVVRNPDLKSITEIDRGLNELIRKAREKALLPDDLLNGTFTLSNLGFGDVDFFTPILRPPESGLLGIGRIIQRPAMRGSEVVQESRIGLSFTCDHRVIDGAPAARFLKTVKERIEDPLLLLV